MRQELAWGTAAAVAIVAAVGISSQPGNKPATSASDRPSGQTVVATKAPKRGAPESKFLPHCSDSIPLLEHFFLGETITGPRECYADKDKATPTPLDVRFQTNFIIATLPDPVHTHFSLLFDRFVEAIQQGAQDERYEYDSSWMPWETEESSLARLKDQDEADDRKDKREDQPGMIIFRHSSEVPVDSPYQKALIVFVVGEEPTRGIHRIQFENAVAWIDALQPTGEHRTSVTILGPTFSGSFPSLSDLLAKTGVLNSMNGGNGISIFSGSASSRSDAEEFAETKNVSFRSFVQDDTTELDRFCKYFDRQEKYLKKLAILSEDETAYGAIPAQGNFGKYKRQGVVCYGATNIYYPRDISSLRAAYQTQSMFSSGSGQQNPDTVQRKSLPTDLADPSRQQHDSVRTYAGNQTPLSQEAQLLGIVDVLRTHRSEYVLLRSSNTLDPLFLANFLRRDYPEARIVVLNSDLLFQRGQDALALAGVMTLSTYPLFSWAREWSTSATDDTHSRRVFSENSTEGTYIASRLLLQTLARDGGDTPFLDCSFSESKEIFVPPLQCLPKSVIYAPLPDYAPPFWMKDQACAEDAAKCGPSTWLSVITRNGTWPLAVLDEHTMSLDVPDTELDGDTRWPPIPRSTQVLLVALCCLAIFHLLCCRFASFTAKPAFRAHFATSDPDHPWLVLIGSYLIVLMALFTGWGTGIFSQVPGAPASKWVVRAVVLFVWIVSGTALVANIKRTGQLNEGAISKSSFRACLTLPLLFFALGTMAFFLLWVLPIEGILLLANRAFVYWRSMNLTSGASPIVPFLSLTIGLYFWFWYALHGLALFGPDRPCLPPLETLGVKLPTPGNASHPEGKEFRLSMFSQQTVAEPAERMAKPLSRGHIWSVLALSFVLALVMFGLGQGVPVRNLGAMRANRYTLIFCCALIFYCSLILTEAWQIWQTWSNVRQLLVFLDRMALRRTLSALHGFSWGTVWKMSGNVLDVRYKLLSRQLECLTHLQNSLRLFKTPVTTEEQAAFAGAAECEESVQLSRGAGMNFAKWYSANYNEPDAADLRDFQAFQKQVAETTGIVLTRLLLPATREEKHSLIQLDPEDPSEKDPSGPPPSKNELIRNAEELVCLTYLGFSQNLLGRIRTVVLGGVYLFLALCIAVSSYPFDPRTLLSGILLLLFVAFGGIVIFTYADMHRDATLSHITNTKPGELGSEFWLKVIGYGAAPFIGLITQIFPEWSGFLFSWLQPGLSSLK